MLMRTIVTLAAVVVLGLGNGLARPIRGNTIATIMSCGMCRYPFRRRPPMAAAGSSCIPP